MLKLCWLVVSNGILSLRVIWQVGRLHGPYRKPYFVYKLPDHSIPGAIRQLRAVLAVGHLVDLILEAQNLGQRIQNIDGEAFVAFRLAKDVLSYHHKGILLLDNINNTTSLGLDVQLNFNYMTWLNI